MASSGSGALLIRPRSEGVSTVAGQMAWVRIPCAVKSAASALVKAMTAPFVVLYTKRFGTPLMLEATEAMLIITPPPFASMMGRNCRVKRYMLFTFISKERSQSFSSQSKIDPL